MITLANIYPQDTSSARASIMRYCTPRRRSSPATGSGKSWRRKWRLSAVRLCSLQANPIASERAERSTGAL